MHNASDTHAQLPLADGGLSFASPVLPGGYRWWYVDAFSADGSAGMTLIIFIGSVFSPYYARARRQMPADPENHVSLNAIFYGPDRKRWALTERGRGELQRQHNVFQVGPSRVTHAGDTLTFDIDEWCVPIPSRLRGVVRVHMRTQNSQCYALDSDGLHRWWPVSPVCDVSVELDKPRLSWEGIGYFDSNGGTAPLEESFKEWHWMRQHYRDHSGTVHYDRQLMDGSWQGLALEHASDGRIASVEDSLAPPLYSFAPTPVWRMGRAMRTASVAAISPLAIQTFEDTPFYARSGIATPEGHDVASVMHESLQLQRFSSRWVQTLLPFRMPRRAGW